MKEDIISMREASEILCISIHTLGSWARKGKVPCAFLTMGGHRRFERSAIIALRESVRGGKKYFDDSSNLPA